LAEEVEVKHGNLALLGLVGALSGACTATVSEVDIVIADFGDSSTVSDAGIGSDAPDTSVRPPLGDVPPIDVDVPERLETATFASGWFWGPDSQFGSLPGVYRTRVGYAGGTTDNPTYRSIGDHTETYQVDFDPEIISYQELLTIYWESHNPTVSGYSRQYRNAILYHDEEQRELAEVSRGETALARGGVRIVTAIEPLGTFTRAENYHQKYSLRHTSLVYEELRAYYPNERDFIDSTSAARLNGYAGGNGTAVRLEEELHLFGLSEPAEEVLRERVRSLDPTCGG
jgi:peptide-methionine (S)-S-oxide reductase